MLRAGYFASLSPYILLFYAQNVGLVGVSKRMRIIFLLLFPFPSRPTLELEPQNNFPQEVYKVGHGSKSYTQRLKGLRIHSNLCSKYFTERSTPMDTVESATTYLAQKPQRNTTTYRR